MTQTSTRSILFRPPFSIFEPGLISNHWSYWPFRVRGNGNYRSQLTFSVNYSVNMANSRWLTTVSRGMYFLKRQHFLHSLPSCNLQICMYHTVFHISVHGLFRKSIHLAFKVAKNDRFIVCFWIGWKLLPNHTLFLQRPSTV